MYRINCYAHEELTTFYFAESAPGGSNYSAPDPDRDLESFDSIATAASVFEARANFDPYYPCVDDEATEMHLYIGEYSDNGPDRILRFGRRGGVRVERY